MAKTSPSRVRLPFQRATGEKAADAAETRPDADGRERRRESGAAPGPAAPGGRRGLPVSGETAFYLVLGALLAAYTVIAFGMEWQTTAGRVGAGLFPRVIGVLGLAVCVVSAVRSALRARSSAAAEPDGGGAESGAAAAAEDEDTDEQTAQRPAGAGQDTRHPWTVVALCLILAAFVTVMVPVGAVITGSLALIAALLLCDRSHPVRSIVLGVAFPVVLYLVFVMGLNAQLPPGILPLY